MNKEDYVSLEVAKLLKEKGFNWPCEYFYSKIYDRIISIIGDDLSRATYEYIGKENILIPSLWDTHKCLREEHNIIVGITCNSTNEWYYSIIVFNSITCKTIYVSEKPYKSYEEALNNGILKALKF
jgi:hypothetical protein